jgi:hypothetical protein
MNTYFDDTDYDPAEAARVERAVKRHNRFTLMTNQQLVKYADRLHPKNVTEAVDHLFSELTHRLATPKKARLARVRLKESLDKLEKAAEHYRSVRNGTEFGLGVAADAHKGLIEAALRVATHSADKDLNDPLSK